MGKPAGRSKGSPSVSGFVQEGILGPQAMARPPGGRESKTDGETGQIPKKQNYPRKSGGNRKVKGKIATPQKVEDFDGVIVGLLWVFGGGLV